VERQANIVKTGYILLPWVDLPLMIAGASGNIYFYKYYFQSMKYQISWLLVFCLLLLLSGQLKAQTLTPKYSNEFLAIGVGSRALAMSNAQVAHVNDASSGYWNPAGLLALEHDYSLSLMHAEYFAGIAKFDYAAFATRVDSSSVLALSVIRFGVDDIPDTRFLFDANGNINYDNIRFFSAADYAFLLSYARHTSWLPGLSVGANAKVVHRSVGQFANAWGFGLDAGAQFRSGPWALGLMLRDITTTFNAWTYNSELFRDVYSQTGNEIPESSLEITLPRAVLGVSKTFQFSERLSGLLALDLVTTFDGRRNVLLKSAIASADPQMGFELGYQELVYLRIGGGQIQQEKNFDGSPYTTFRPTAGLGIRLHKVVIDYALTDVGNQASAPYSHVFSLKVNLNKKDE
jgi:hypothetical protein